MIYRDGSEKIKTKKNIFPLEDAFRFEDSCACLILDDVRKWTRVIEVKVENIHIFTDIIFCNIYEGFTQHFQLNILLKRDYFLGDWVVPDS